MRWKNLLLLIFLIFLFGMVLIYLFLPFLSETSFTLGSRNSNFTLDSKELSTMQFYPNMRFPSNEITYTIDDCTVKKVQDMEQAFNIMENLTILRFERVVSNGEIEILCDSTSKIEDGLFIAGEGGPSNITQTDLFNVISRGKILLFKDSSCPTPNIAIHELLHVLGFEHSDNENNIMYPITKCKQTIGDDTVSYLNYLYSITSEPDLVLKNVSASFSGRYFNTQMEISNQGLTASEKTSIKIYGDDRLIKEVDVSSLDYGYGRIITLNNVWVLNRFDSVRYVIDSDFKEIDKSNNEVVLVVSS